MENVVGKKKTSWSWIALVSFAVSGLALALSLLWQVRALGLLLWLFLFGAVAGWLSQRHGWLSGIIVGLPLALFQLTRLALPDYGSALSFMAQPDYWRLLVPASVVSTGMAIMGGIVGAWVGSIRLQLGKRAG